MRIYKSEKGTPYFQVETDLRAILSKRKVGDKILDEDNHLLYDMEIHFIRKVKK